MRVLKLLAFVFVGLPALAGLAVIVHHAGVLPTDVNEPLGRLIEVASPGVGRLRAWALGEIGERLAGLSPRELWFLAALTLALCLAFFYKVQVVLLRWAGRR